MDCLEVLLTIVAYRISTPMGGLNINNTSTIVTGKILYSSTQQRGATMTRVAILPVPNSSGGLSYRAIAGNKQSVGKTAGEALDALTAQLDESETGTLVIIQNYRSDQFFTAQQQQRLSELMELWRSTRDRGEAISPEQQAELDALVEAELRASAAS